VEHHAITVATVSDPSIITGLFGSGHTRILQIDVACHTVETKAVKAKADSIFTQTIEVEVGVVGSWDRFKSFGGRGLRVLDEHSEALGTILTLICTRQEPQGVEIHVVTSLHTVAEVRRRVHGEKRPECVQCTPHPN